MRFVVCGEALIDLVPEGSGSDTFRSGWAALSAGGPLNTAIGLARLGESVEFAGRLSTDRFGRQLRDHLTANGVGVGRAVFCPDPTPLAVVSLDSDGRASYAFHFDRTAAFGASVGELSSVGPDEWLHLGSLATVVEPGASALLAWAGRHSGALSLDLNVRPSVIADPAEYWRRARPWLEVAGRGFGLSRREGGLGQRVVKASDEDVEFLAAASGETGSAEEVMGRWQDRFGFGTAVVTLGPAGAWARGPAGEVRVPGRAVEVVDTVGAGDTFMAGFLTRLATSGDLAAAVVAGVTAAAYVCTRRGPQPPTRPELEAFAGG